MEPISRRARRASAKGLARFDGLEFQVFDRSATPLMTNTTAQALLEDTEGAPRIGTEGGGVLGLNAGTWSAYRSDSGPPRDIVHTLLLDRQGAVWAGTYAGVGRRNGKRWVSYPIGEDGRNYRVRCLLEDRRGHLWFSSNKGVSEVPLSDLEEDAAGRVFAVR